MQLSQNMGDAVTPCILTCVFVSSIIFHIRASNSMVTKLQSESIFDFHGYMLQLQRLWYQHIIKKKKKFDKQMFLGN